MWTKPWVSCLPHVSTLVVQNMKLTDATFSDDVISIAFINSLYSNATRSSIQFLNCFFSSIKGKSDNGLIAITKHVVNRLQLSIILMLHCKFTNINVSTILRTDCQGATSHIELLLFVQNTSFSMIKVTDTVLRLEITHLKLGPAIFTKIQSSGAVIYTTIGKIQLEGNVTFSQNHGNYCVVTEYIILSEQSKLIIVANIFL